MTHALRTLTVSALDGTRIARQFVVGQPPSRHRPKRLSEPVGILAFALVKPQSLLVQIPEQVVGFDGHIGSLQRPLQEAPEVL